jgi:inorganic pyrophosphatase
MEPSSMHAIDRISPFAAADEQQVHVVIDTPRGSRSKVKWHKQFGVFKLSQVLTQGAVFPFDFGFVPGTLAEDGDELDVLVLVDEPLFAGCLVQARLIGGIEAEQTQDGKTLRNDRLLAVAAASKSYGAMHDLDDLPPKLLSEIEQFFVHYNRMRDRVFKPTGNIDAKQALANVRSAVARKQKDQARH